MWRICSPLRCQFTYQNIPSLPRILIHNLFYCGLELGRGVSGIGMCTNKRLIVTGLFGPGIWVSDPHGLIRKVEPVDLAWGAEGFDPFVPGHLHRLVWFIKSSQHMPLSLCWYFWSYAFLELVKGGLTICSSSDRSWTYQGYIEIEMLKFIFTITITLMLEVMICKGL